MPPATAAMMHDDAVAIWTAGISAVQPEALVAARLWLDADGRRLLCDGRPFDPPLDLSAFDRIVVVGGGKAAAGLAAGIERLLGAAVLERHRVTGLVSVPEGCGRTLARIEVRETRPAAANIPTPAVVRATHEMLALLRSLGARDLALAVITGGGSALLAAPRHGVTLDDKIALTRRLSAAGADIATLNAARREMSLVKGGGLARACAAGRLVVLAISDVVGDDLDVIASGPCMPPAPHAGDGTWTTPSGCRVSHLLLGTNATAVQAAAVEAARRGYEIEVRHAAAGPATADVAAVAARFGREAVALSAAATTPRAVIEGGEATVTVPTDHGVGGRNQQTVLAVLEEVRHDAGGWPDGLLVASIGTDGEDGPTDAAGGFIDASVAATIDRTQLDVPRALARCDALPVLEHAGGLVRTGPTGTNVADLRIVLVRPAATD